MGARPRALHLAPMMPATGGNGLAMRQSIFLEALSRDFDVDLIILPVAGEQHAAAELPHRLGVPWNVIPVADRRDTHFELLMQLGDQDARLAAFRSYGRSSLAAAISVPVVSDLRQQLAGRRYDLVHAGRSYLADALPAVGCVGQITLDLDEDERVSFSEMATVVSPLDEAAAAWAEAEGEALDRLIAQRGGEAERVFISSAVDAATVSVRHPGLSVEVAVNAVALPEIHRKDDGLTALFVGSFGYFPNRDAAHWLAGAIWPLVHRALPAARLLIVGQSAGRLRGIETDSIEIIGEVREIDEAYARASVTLAPLRAGAGTRIKLIEAAAHGVPMIATSLAARGLNFIQPRDIWIADEAQAFADAVVAALGSPSERRCRAANALSVAQEHHDRSKLVAALACRFAAMLAR